MIKQNLSLSDEMWKLYTTTQGGIARVKELRDQILQNNAIFDRNQALIETIEKASIELNERK